MEKLSDVITLKRTHPVQGKEVKVEVFWNTDSVGLLHFPFVAWIKFNRLLQKGVELDGREGNTLNVKLRVVGVESLDMPVTRLAPQREVFGAPANLEARDEYDEAPVKRVVSPQAIMPQSLPTSMIPIIPSPEFGGMPPTVNLNDITLQIGSEDELDPDIVAAEYAAAVEQQQEEVAEQAASTVSTMASKLVRSLKPEGGE